MILRRTASGCSLGPAELAETVNTQVFSKIVLRVSGFIPTFGLGAFLIEVTLLLWAYSNVRIWLEQFPQYYLRAFFDN